ncbi:acyltransferase family protein [Endothiovibrio diazotrophicus]
MATKAHRYAYLDGIRGVAALFVVMRHTTDLWEFVVYRTYLAVDIFFILSGFVIANAYGRKMAEGTLSFKGFVLVRLVRLYPVYFISLCFAIPLYLYGLAEQGTPMATPEAMTLIALSLLILPGVAIPEGLLFPINGPYWSLFYELLANFLYAATRRWLTRKVLLSVIVVCGLLLAAAAVYQGNMDYGFIYAPRGFFAGLVRASYGIFFGIFLHAQMGRWNIRPRPWLAIALICGVFLIPEMGGLDPLIDTLAIWFVFPACVVLAASTTIDLDSKVTRTMLFLGSASYPVYVLHEPLGQLVLIATDGYAATFAPYSGWIFLILLAPLASLLERRVDEPARKWFARTFLKKGPSVSADGPPQGP